MEKAGDEADDLLSFPKTLSRMIQNEALAGIRRGDGYAKRLVGRRTFTVACFGRGKNLSFLSYLQTVLNYTN